MKIQDAYSLPGNHIMPSQSTALIYWVSLTCVYMCVLVTQSCPTLCNSMDCRPPDSSVHGILQARILEWVVIPFKNTGVGGHSLLQEICLTQGLNLGLLHCRQIRYHLSHQGTPPRGRGSGSNSFPPSSWLLTSPWTEVCPPQLGSYLGLLPWLE